MAEREYGDILARIGGLEKMQTLIRKAQAGMRISIQDVKILADVADNVFPKEK